MISILKGFADSILTSNVSYFIRGMIYKKSEAEKRFDYCITIILQHEGGLSNNKGDPGGITDFGISLRFLRQVGLNIDDEPAIDDADIESLTKPYAIEIYRKYWWCKYGYEKFIDIDVVAKVFDLSVLMGQPAAIKILQRSINRLQSVQIKVDGELGDKTFLAANKQNPKLLREQMRFCAKEKLAAIADKFPALQWAKKGWINRAEW